MSISDNASVASWISGENDGFSQLSDSDGGNADSYGDFSFSWKIQNFSLCFHQKGEALESPILYEPRFDGQWIVQLYPKGCKKEDDGFISLYLQQKKVDRFYESNDITFFVSIVNDNCVSIFSDRKRKILKNKTCERLGWSRFLEFKQLETFLKDCADDIIRINCSMRCRRFPKRLNTSEVFTEVCVSKNVFVWNVENQGDSEIRRTEFAFSDSLSLEITICWIKAALQICIHQKKLTNNFVRCTLSLRGAKGNVLVSKTANHIFKNNSKSQTWEFPNFITTATVYENKSSFVKKNMLTLRFEFSVSNNMVLSKVIDEPESDENGYSVLQEDIKSMYLNCINSDVKFKIGDEILHAHKCILSARSPVFLTMFNQDMKESQIGIVDILDTSVNTLKSFLKFIYTAEVEMKDYRKVKNLLLVAHKYQVLPLMEKCVSFLKLEISLLNVCEMLIVADLIGHHHLKRVTMDFITLNSAIIFNTPEWLDLVAKHFKLVGEVFANISANFFLIPKINSACKTDNWYQERKSRKRKSSS